MPRLIRITVFKQNRLDAEVLGDVNQVRRLIESIVPPNTSIVTDETHNPVTIDIFPLEEYNLPGFIPYPETS